jgi:DivIVA domain-containing protein
MTSGQNGTGQEPRGLTPADLQNVRFTRASMMRPGYVDAEVDRVMSRVAEELGRLYSEKAALRDEVRALRTQVEDLAEGVAAVPEPPSEQAVRILASAQLTADNYVAEAEEFSRQVTSEARAEYEELTRAARDTAGGIIQAAQEAAAKLADGAPLRTDGGSGRSVEELEEQVAYLKAFGQACRVQLRSYLEALLSDVESEWGRADPAAVQAERLRPPAQRSASDDGSGAGTTFVGNMAVEAPPDDGVEVVHSAARSEPGS